MSCPFSKMDKRHAFVFGAVGVAVTAWHYIAYKKSCKQAQLAAGKVNKGTVSQLWVHPIKGCSGAPVERVQVVKEGFKYDREWGIFSEESNKCIQCHHNSQLKLVSAHVDETRGVLVISSEGGPKKCPAVTKEVKLDNTTGEVVEVKVSTMMGKVRKEPEDVSKWISDFIGEEVYLARTVSNRRCNTHKVNHSVARSSDYVKLQSFSTCHLVSEEGLAHIRKVSGAEHFKASTTRPNVVVSGFPFSQEDSFEKIHINNINFQFCRWTSRCPLMNIDDEGNSRGDEEPLTTMKKLRSCHNLYLEEKTKATLGAMFGINLFHNGEGEIKIGDVVEVDEWHAEPQFVEV